MRSLDVPSVVFGIILGILAVVAAVAIAIPLRTAPSATPGAAAAATPVIITAPATIVPTLTPMPTPSPTTIADRTPQTAPVATPFPAPLVFAGSTDKKSKPFELDGPARVDYTAAGSGNFIVDLDQQGGGTVASIANLIGRAKVTTWVYGASGLVYFDVIADGAWKVTITPMVPPSLTTPALLTGSTNLTTAPLTLASGETVVWNCTGTGNFIVELVDPTDGSNVEGVVNVIGTAHDTTQIESQGDFAVDVIADGAWTLRIGP